MTIKELIKKSYDDLLSLELNIKNVLKLSNYEEKFPNFIGNLYHRILSLYEKTNFDFENEFNKLKITDFLIPTYSYVSIIELGNYLAGKSDEDPYENPHIKPRLFPELPQTEYICFYPMDKRRNETYNWYMLPLEERQALMYNHGKIGRQYAGKIKQFITGSMGFDDFEWGVTLFADDPLQFKKIVSEMRFDETTARYGDFGSFYVGTIITKHSLPTLFEV